MCGGPTTLSQTHTEISTDNRLNRAVWHQPLVSIIVTHYNYSDYIREALLSILDQTHQNWECVVVDDASSLEHKQRLAEIIEAIGCEKIRAIYLPENGGQVPAFFAGADATSGQFVCMLDPDDRYAETFLAEAVAAHLNETVVCPVLSTEQYTLVNGQVTTASKSARKLRKVTRYGNSFEVNGQNDLLLFFPSSQEGWLWTSTSAIMYRRAVLEYLRPHKKLSYKNSADAYLANGAHLLGGSLFLTKPLVYRMLHNNNDRIVQNIYSSFQGKSKEGVSGGLKCRIDVLEALHHNKAPLTDKLPSFLDRSGKRRLQRWQRSMMKRWNRLKGAFRSGGSQRVS